MIGKTVERVAINDARNEIDFHTEGGGHFRMYHGQDCCERVSIEDIEGDIQSLIGNPILAAEAASFDDPGASESGTWTFYKLATINGHVDIRWYGSSNGYYSERVSFQDMANDKDWGRS